MEKSVTTITYTLSSVYTLLLQCGACSVDSAAVWCVCSNCMETVYTHYCCSVAQCVHYYCSVVHAVQTPAVWCVCSNCMETVSYSTKHTTAAVWPSVYTTTAVWCMQCRLCCSVVCLF